MSGLSQGQAIYGCKSSEVRAIPPPGEYVLIVEDVTPMQPSPGIRGYNKAPTKYIPLLVCIHNPARFVGQPGKKKRGDRKVCYINDHSG